MRSSKNNMTWLDIITLCVRLVDDLEGSTALDQVPGALTRDHNAANRRIAWVAIAAMDKELWTTAHVVGGRRIQLVAVRHAFVSHHVTQRVGAGRKRTNILLAGTWGVVAARAGRATARISGFDPRAIIASAGEMVRADVVGVRTSSSQVQRSYNMIQE